MYIMFYANFGHDGEIMTSNNQHKNVKELRKL